MCEYEVKAIAKEKVKLFLAAHNGDNIQCLDLHCGSGWYDMGKTSLPCLEKGCSIYRLRSKGFKTTNLVLHEALWNAHKKGLSVSYKALGMEEWRGIGSLSKNLMDFSGLRFKMYDKEQKIGWVIMEQGDEKY